MEMGLADKIKGHRQVFYKRDFVRENKERLSHFGDGLNLGERKDESMTKNMHTSFHNHVAETADSYVIFIQIL
jgi:hypothetical protein